MKQNIIPAIRLTIVCILLFMVAYPALIFLIARAAPAGGEGQIVVANGRTAGYLLEGQSFTWDSYFQGRPSAAGYNAAGSSGSNKGPSNPDYLKMVRDRIDSFVVHNPTVQKGEIPSDLVTASGSGLDPDISLKSAIVQVNRIVDVRKLPREQVMLLVQRSVEKSINGIEKINVLKINIALDQLSKGK